MINLIGIYPCLLNETFADKIRIEGSKEMCVPTQVQQWLTSIETNLGQVEGRIVIWNKHIKKIKLMQSDLKETVRSGVRTISQDTSKASHVKSLLQSSLRHSQALEDQFVSVNDQVTACIQFLAHALLSITRVKCILSYFGDSKEFFRSREKWQIKRVKQRIVAVDKKMAACKKLLIKRHGQSILVKQQVSIAFEHCILVESQLAMLNDTIAQDKMHNLTSSDQSPFYDIN